jgi:hypothetical protein
MPLRRRPSLPAPAAIALAAAAFAAAELILTVTFGRFFEWGRAEALLFFAWRPWLLIVAAAFASHLRWPRRLLFYLLALLAAGLGESFLLLPIGASDPWPEMLRGLLAAGLLLIPVDLLVRAGRRWFGKAGAAAAAMAAILLLLVPGLRAPYDALAVGPETGAPSGSVRPPLLVMTSLPIVWGERGAFDPGSGPSETYRALQEEYEVRPIDLLDEASLARGRLLLLAQPRWLAPSELAALDSWVRRGGAVLILADPALAWPSDLPLGDLRRPVPASLLAPLLAHWRLELRPPARPRLATIWTGTPARPLRSKLVLDSPGRFAGGRGTCAIGLNGYFADCRIGVGKAALVADADLLRDDLWMAPGSDGAARHRRIADNPLVVADMLDTLAGVKRGRVRRPVAWAEAGPSRGPAMAAAFLPAILLAGVGLLLIWRARSKPQTYPQDYKA